MAPPLLEIRDLHLKMTTSDGPAHVLNGVGLSVARGEILGLVGESGCGKSTLARLITLIEEPSAGALTLDGLPATPENWRRLRSTVQIVFR
ncbi:ATP-binding cassette domain-containing protein, partial [Rhodovulum sulfidophilum]|nr:ATP-binding cassette domain-containing protein [Rhodovulum sulfidophilum]